MTTEMRERVLSLNSWHDDWSGLRVAVLGLGVTGFSVADTLSELGAQVRVIYAKPDAQREQLLDVIGAERFVSGEDDEQLVDLVNFDPELVVVSPGYRPDHPLTVWAEQQKITVWSDIQLGWRLRDKTAKVADWLCVTGTNGKTTTAQLTAHMLVAGGLAAAPVGNIGVPILDALRDPQGFDALVVELSSFQLHRLGDISPYSSVCLNLADDHLDWHGGRQQYIDAKARVYENVQVACVYNRADTLTEELVLHADVVEGARAISFGLDSPPSSGVGMIEDILIDRSFHDERLTTALELVTRSELAERGLDAPHLIQDVLAAAALARSRGVSPEQIASAVLNFTLDKHRVQRVAKLKEVAWIDDSKATNAHAAAASLRSFERVVWIVGGQLKGASLEELVGAHHGRLAAAVIIGTDRSVIAQTLKRHAPALPVFEIAAENPDDVMEEAVRIAAEIAESGDTVLLSPAAASLDQFDSFQDRGQRFQRAVLGLSGGGEGASQTDSTRHGDR